MSAAAAGMRLVIGGSRCDGHGICLLVCPELVSLDEWGYASVDEAPITEKTTLARARRAVTACPVGALTILPATAPAPPVRRGGLLGETR